MTFKFVGADGSGAGDVAERQKWMATLAKAPARALKTVWAELPEEYKPETSFLRAPEFGMTMVRGRAGSGGARFNIGEMTITRCTIRVREGVTGTAYVQGRDKDRAVIAATVDAMMQVPAMRTAASENIIEPLDVLMTDARATEARKTAATKVDFFTMVRARDGK